MSGKSPDREAGGETQVQAGIVELIDFDTYFQFFSQLFDTALNLYRFCRLVPETLDEIFCCRNCFCWSKVGTHLLLDAFLAEDYELPR